MKGISHRKAFAEGQAIFHEGQQGECAYLVNSGKIEIRKIGEANSDQLIAVVGENELFGEMALIDGSPRMATAIAVEPTECTVIEKYQLIKKLAKTDKDTRFVIRFLIDFIRTTPPYDMRQDGKDGNGPSGKDSTAGMILKSKSIALSIRDEDPFLQALFEVLISYARRRLPPEFQHPISESGG